LTHEAQFAESRKDFIHKHRIALKEANETKYWLNLVNDTVSLEKNNILNLIKEIIEIIKYLTAIINTARKNVNRF